MGIYGGEVELIYTLNPSTSEFEASLWEAWQWTQERKAFYFRTGGYQSFPDYLRIAKADNRKQFAVVWCNHFVSLITVELFAKNCYEFHVTSNRGVGREFLQSEISKVVDSLFTDLNAECLATMVPKYNGHTHTGSRALAEYFGCVPDGPPEIADWVDGKIIEYQLYVLSKESWDLKWAAV